MENVRRIYVEKKDGFDVEAKEVLEDLRQNLSMTGLERVRIINRYDVEGISDEEYAKARNLIFSEPPVDNAWDEEMGETDGRVFAVEFLPGQFDQRAASAEECISILTEKERPRVRSAKVYVLMGNVSAEDVEAAKKYVINPVEAREASLEKPQTLDMDIAYPEDVKTVDGFNDMNDSDIEEFIGKMGFAMDADDLGFCREYFKNTEKRNPTAITSKKPPTSSIRESIDIVKILCTSRQPYSCRYRCAICFISRYISSLLEASRKSADG